jgi:hypothetical protein
MLLLKGQILAWCMLGTCVQGQLEGWRMVDRFSGFRYEVQGKVCKRSSRPRPV